MNAATAPTETLAPILRVNQCVHTFDTTISIIVGDAIRQELEENNLGSSRSGRAAIAGGLRHLARDMERGETVRYNGLRELADSLAAFRFTDDYEEEVAE